MNKSRGKRKVPNARVVLAGTGPGSYDLVTVGLLERLRRADAVVHDRLLPPELLLAVPPGAECYDVGKVPGRHDWPQEKINRLLIELAGRHRLVVRLKGGDPYVFGRGGEEAAALSAAGIAWEVLPGVSAFSAVPARFDIPVTHRGIASAACLITGHEDPEKAAEDLDYAALARFPGTRIFFMGIRSLPQIVQRLLEEGLDPQTPAAVLQAGYLRQLPPVHATLASLPAAVKAAGVRPPALTVIGSVTTLPGLIRQLPPAYRLLFPRPFEEWLRWRGEFALRGVELVPLPLIETRPLANRARLREVLERFAEFRHLVFTSANGVRHFIARLAEVGRDLRCLAGKRLTVIGPGTADALSVFGLQADAVAGQHLAEGVLELFRDLPREGVLVARALHCRRTLVDGLRGLGFPVEELKVYRTLCPPLPTALEDRVRAGEFEGALFTAGSTLRHFLRRFSPAVLAGREIIAIGPQTAGHLARAGLPPDATATTFSMEGILRLFPGVGDENRR